MSIWDDYGYHMLWLDSTFPTDMDPSIPGVGRGPCAIDSGNPDQMRQDYIFKDVYVKYYDLKVGPINSTYLLNTNQAQFLA